MVQNPVLRMLTTSATGKVRGTVCNPNRNWKWKHIKRKTDRDDALKLAKVGRAGAMVPSTFVRSNANIVGW